MEQGDKNWFNAEESFAVTKAMASLSLPCQRESTVDINSLSQFFSWEFCGKWASLLAKISLRLSQASKSHEKGQKQYIVKLASLTILKLVLILASLATKFLFARLVRSESCYKISVCKTHKKWVIVRNLPVRLVRIESCYEISVCKTREKWVSLLILTCKSRKNFGSKKSESRFSREFQKVILVSTLRERRPLATTIKSRLCIYGRSKIRLDVMIWARILKDFKIQLCWKCECRVLVYFFWYFYW